MYRAIRLLLISLVTLAYSASWVRIAAAETYLDVSSVAEAEIEVIEQEGFEVPPFTLITLDKWKTSGNTVLMREPVKYVIILWNFYYDEAHARKVVAHELAHILFAEAGVTQSELFADTFAACFGSEQARKWALNVEANEPATADCEHIRGMVMQDQSTDPDIP